MCSPHVLQVVPDVAPGFNVPKFYDDFVEQRRDEVAEQARWRSERRKRDREERARQERGPQQ